MKIDKLKNYSLELILCIILFFALFVSNIITRTVLSIILLVYSIITYTILKKRNVISMHNKQVTVLMTLFAIVYLIAFYLIGAYVGFYESNVKFSIWTMFNYIIPIGLIILSSEIIRSVFLATKETTSNILTTVAMILIDLIVYTNIYNLSNLEGFLIIIGFSLFSSISFNLLYNYVAVRFGIKPIIAFRLITTLYAYIIPIIPDIYIFFRSFLRMICPYFIYVLLDQTYSKDNLIDIYRSKRKSLIYTLVIIAIMIVIIMLISCEFKYGVLVIGSGSMTGTINKGDAIIFEAYNSNKQVIKVGDVIIFNKENMKLVHRVIEKKLVNGQNRYYTKGDSNPEMDEGYITESQIVGIVKLKLVYIGYPTLWVRSIFMHK